MHNDRQMMALHCGLCIHKHVHSNTLYKPFKQTHYNALSIMKPRIYTSSINKFIFKLHVMVLYIHVLLCCTWYKPRPFWYASMLAKMYGEEYIDININDFIKMWPLVNWRWTIAGLAEIISIQQVHMQIHVTQVAEYLTVVEWVHTIWEISSME